MTDRFHAQLRQFLLQFRAARLQHGRRAGADILTGTNLGENAQFGRFQHHNLTLKIGHFGSKIIILKQGLAFADHITGQFFDFFQAAIQTAGIGIATLKFQKIFGASPAFVQIADKVFLRHFHIFKKHLVNLLRAFSRSVQRHQWRHSDTRRVHINQQK